MKEKEKGSGEPELFTINIRPFWISIGIAFIVIAAIVVCRG